MPPSVRSVATPETPLALYCTRTTRSKPPTAQFAQVHSLPKVSSEELLPCLESVLSFDRDGGAAAPCAQGKAEEQRGLAEVGINPQRAEAVERAVQETGARGGGEQAQHFPA